MQNKRETLERIKLILEAHKKITDQGIIPTLKELSEESGVSLVFVQEINRYLRMKVKHQIKRGKSNPFDKSDIEKLEALGKELMEYLKEWSLRYIMNPKKGEENRRGEYVQSECLQIKTLNHEENS